MLEEHYDIEVLPNGAWVGYTPEYLRVELPCRNGAQGQYRRVRAAACTEDGLLQENHRFRNHMEKIHFPGYCYIEDAGSHTWEFWDHYIQDGLRFLLETGAQ